MARDDRLREFRLHYLYPQPLAAGQIGAINLAEDQGDGVDLAEVTTYEVENGAPTLHVVDEDVRIEDQACVEPAAKGSSHPGGRESAHVLQAEPQDLRAAAQADLLALDRLAHETRKPVAGEIESAMGGQRLNSE